MTLADEPVCYCGDTRWVESVRINDKLVESVTFDMRDPMVDYVVEATRIRHESMVAHPGVQTWAVVMECPSCHGGAFIDGDGPLTDSPAQRDG